METFGTISLFTGAGGLDYGFEAAGFRTCVAVESDPDCCATLAANRSWPIIQADIHQVPSETLLAVAGLQRGEVTLLLGGPPCQPFSKSAYWATGDTRRLNDPRAATLRAYMRCVADVLPAVFVVENVPGISYVRKQEGLRLLQRLTAEINRNSGTTYRLSWRVLNAADYGVPQLRSRFFLVGHRDGKAFAFPARTHGPASSSDATLAHLLPYVTAWDAIGNLPSPDDGAALRLRGRWADLLPSIPEGENYLWHTNRKGGLPLFGWRTRYWSFLLKLAKQRPSWTIQAQPSQATGPFHWENRRLSAIEMARLQTFPKEVVLLGSPSSIQRQLGNAVPSLFAETLAREIAGQLLGSPRIGPLQLAIQPVRPIPPPTQTDPVAMQYLSLIGDYPDHPEPCKASSRRQPIVAQV
jgi:DNA (cytosine-5)-methyltransferase 1